MKCWNRFYSGRRSKRGSLDDLIYIVGVLGVFALMLLISGSIVSSFNTQAQATPGITADATLAVQQIDNLYDSTLDQSFLYLAIGLAIIALIFAALIAVHPVFFVFYLIFLAVVIIISGVLSNIYQMAAQQPDLAPIASRLVITSHMMQYLPFITGIIGFAIAFMMYKSYKEASG